MLVEVAIGEVVDKITILQIKLERIKDPSRLEDVLTELNILQNALKRNGITVDDEFFQRLKQINETIWDTEDKLRKDDLVVGDFILAGGEIAAQALIESTVRTIPGTLGHKNSSTEESFNNDLLEFPQYTRPKVWNNLEIPKVLTSGNHEKIALWRKDMAEKLTKKIRPDLWKKYKKNKTIKK